MAAKAAAKTTAHKSTVRNPSTRFLTGATSGTKKATAKKGQTVQKATTTTKKKPATGYKRNPAFMSNEFFVAFGGALAIVGFDFAVNRFFPSVSGLLRTGAKFGLGWGIGKYGKRLPLIGNFTGLIKTGLYIAGALDLVQTYALPWVNQYLGAPAAAQPVLVAENVQANNAGEMGSLWQYPNGEQFILVNDRAPNYTGVNPYAASYAGVF